MPKFTRATSLFLDLFGVEPGHPDLGLLGEISANFAQLPWENLTKFIKKHGFLESGAVGLPPEFSDVPGSDKLRLSDEVLDDHARLKTGGTCFSLTNALRRITSDLGFRACPVMADMHHGPNVHCALRVDLDDGPYLLDPGYLVAEPMPIRRGRTVRIDAPGQSLEYRAVSTGDEFEMRTTNDRGEERLRYRLRARPVTTKAFVRHWLHSFELPGMNGLHLNRITVEGRLSAHDYNLRIDTGRDKSNVKLRGDYVEQVSERFGV